MHTAKLDRRPKVFRLSSLAVAALLPATLMAAELACPPFAEPKAKVQWVAPYMIYNGVQMSVKRFDSEHKPADVLAFYRQAWKAAGPAAPQEYMAGQWQTIAAMRGKCFFTVQVQAAGNGSTGLLSATQPLDQPRVDDADRALPMMTGSTILNDIGHRDGGKEARTVLLRNGFSADSNADFYRQHLADQGWKVVASHAMTTKKGPGITLVMKRGVAEASLVITGNGRNTMVLANLVDKP
jgi:hypothetical protein